MEKLRKKQRGGREDSRPEGAREGVAAAGARAEEAGKEDPSRRPSSSPASARRGPAQAAQKAGRRHAAGGRETQTVARTPRRTTRKPLTGFQEAQEEVKKAREQVEEELRARAVGQGGRPGSSRCERAARSTDRRGRKRISKSLLQQPENWRARAHQPGRPVRNQGKEQGLAKDLAALAEEEAGSAPGLRPPAAEDCRRDGPGVEEAEGAPASLVRDQRDKPETEAVADAARLQKEALDRLEGVLQTLKEEQNAPLAQRNDGGGRWRGRGRRRGGCRQRQ